MLFKINTLQIQAAIYKDIDKKASSVKLRISH